MKELLLWASSPSRKPLILRGARQVGKTTIIKQFADSFDQFIYLNLDRPGETDIFRKNLSVNDLFQAILISKKTQSTSTGRCLLFIDEIQQSPEAVAYLRYFKEEMASIFVIAAGSLLDVMIAKGSINFPVGRVEYLRMYPLTFDEYLQAMELKQLRDAFMTVPIPAFAHDMLLKEFHTYTLIGGMPEVVAAYSKTGAITQCNEIYSNLMTSFIDDIPKYARNHTLALVMRHCFENAPAEAGKRITFARFGKSQYRSREVGESLLTLERAMLLHLIYPTVFTEQPATPDKGKAPRILFFDTGLLNYSIGVQGDYFTMDNLHSLHRGMLAEHIVGQELIAHSPDELHYPGFWVRENPQANAEVDYLFAHRNIIIPVEVKAGSTGTLRSLQQFMDRCGHDMSIRLYAGNISTQKCKRTDGREYRLLNLPYYLASKLGEYLEWAFG